MKKMAKHLVSKLMLLHHQSMRIDNFNLKQWWKQSLVITTNEGIYAEGQEKDTLTLNCGSS